MRMKFKFLCRLFKHRWGTFTCLRCGKIKPVWVEIAKSLTRISINLLSFWKGLDEFRKRRDREYEEMLDRPETTGEILKGLGIKRERPKAEKPDKTFRFPRIIKPAHDRKTRLRNTWRPLLDRLLTGETVRIGPNDYFGKIRGVDILIAAKKDLKRLGYDVEVKMKGHGGTIRLK